MTEIEKHRKLATELFEKFEPQFQLSSVRMGVYLKLARHVQDLILDGKIEELKRPMAYSVNGELKSLDKEAVRFWFHKYSLKSKYELMVITDILDDLCKEFAKPSVDDLVGVLKRCRPALIMLGVHLESQKSYKALGLLRKIQKNVEEVLAHHRRINK